MTTIGTIDARKRLSEVINTVAYGKERVVLTRRGKKLVAIVPIEDIEVLEELEDKIDIEEARLALAEAKKKGTIPWEELKAKLGIL